jgi:signal transduction histidine kinase
LAHRPLGIVVFGTSPKIAIDDFYRSFFDLAPLRLRPRSQTRAYEQERQRAEALTAIDRARTIFFTNVSSHEIRTPLTLILGPLEEALRDTRTERDSASRVRPSRDRHDL